MNLTLVVDTSCSMTGAPLTQAKTSCRAIASSLKAGDVFSMVTWSTDQNEVLGGHAVTQPGDPTILEACDGMQSDGGTNLNAGLRAGYALALDHHLANAINRVVLVSDGGANVGETDAEIIAENASFRDADGIYMAGLGVGTATTYHDDLMDRVTDIGRGAAVFVPDADEAERMFQGRFLEVFDVAARAVEVRLDLPEDFEIVRFSGEEKSTNRAEVEPQHLAPNDAMVFFQHIRTPCETTPDDTPLTVVVEYEPALGGDRVQIERSFTFGELLAQATPHLSRGAAVFTYAEALQEPSEANRNEAYRALSRAEEAYPGDAELAEIRATLDLLAP